jgi:hypothetical protein
MFDNDLGSISITPSGKIGIGIGEGLTIIPERGTIGIGDDGLTIDPTEGIREAEKRREEEQRRRDEKKRSEGL